jgi:hypothetical protein
MPCYEFELTPAMVRSLIRFLLFIPLLMFATTASATDMSFALQERDLRPNFDLDQWVFADGEIVPGTFDRFQSFLKAHPSLIAGATVILNSPGGSVAEGIKLGDAIRDLHFRTDVGTVGIEIMSIAPGLCLSACIYPYLGGEYRYLHDRSAIGVHRFSFVNASISANDAAESSQLLAGSIVEFLNKSRVTSDFFPLMTKTPPENIQIIPAEQLRTMRVVTDDIFSESWSFESVMGRAYLKGDQITRRGENKLLFLCDSDGAGQKLLLTAMSELSGRQQIIDSYKVILLFLDGIPIEMPVNLIYDRPKLSGKLWIEWSFLVTPDLAARLGAAEKIGSGISPAAHIFSGFTGIELGSGKNKMLELFGQCNSIQYSRKTSTVSLNDSADVALATRLARNLDREFRKGGMIRLRQSVEDCYKMVRLHPISSSIEYCYILDQISCGLDESFWRNIGKPQPDEFWRKESGTARTLAVLASVKTNAGSYDDALSQWQMTKNAALGVMLSMRH